MAQQTSAPALNILPDPSALTTRVFSNSLYTTTPASVLPFLQDTFNVNGNCPYFSLFAGFIPSNASTSTTTTAGVRLDFSFLNAGSIVSGGTFVFGDPTELAAGLAGNTQAFIMPIIGNVQIAAFQPQASGNCVLFNLNYSNNGGAFRWSAVANQVQIKTSVVAAAQDNPFTLVHGVIQQPWG